MNIKRAEQIYEQIKVKLHGNEGKIIAIDVDSGDYFLGTDTIDAINLGKKKYPSKQFYLKRIGATYTYVVGAR